MWSCRDGDVHVERTACCSGIQVAVEFFMDNKNICHLFYSSGLVRPPFMHNGFTAELEFIKMEKHKEKTSRLKQNPSVENNLVGSENQQLVLQADEAILRYIRPSRVIEQVTRPNPQSRHLDMHKESTTFKCRDEITGTHRSGFITSSRMVYSNSTCSIVFRGEERDLVLIKINNLQLT